VEVCTILHVAAMWNFGESNTGIHDGTNLLS
jgi:hypothetical protein